MVFEGVLKDFQNRTDETKKNRDPKRREQYREKVWKQSDVLMPGVSKKPTVSVQKVCVVRERCQEVRRERKAGGTCVWPLLSQDLTLDGSLSHDTHTHTDTHGG